MNAPVLNHAAPQRLQVGPAVRGWRRIGLAAGGGVLLLAALFRPEVVAAIQTWNDSTAYNHCYLVIPIALYLLWDRRFDLAGLAPRPMPAAVMLGLPMAGVWLLAERLGIMEGRQLVAVSFVELLLFALLGRRLWWAMAGPLLYLYFLVPFAEFLTPDLQAFTTGFIRVGLDVLGIPAYVDGYTIEIPQGTFFVAEACAGLRFLIAAIAFGCLYALLIYRTPLRRGVFMVVSIIVPIIANGFRGLGIVYLGYWLNSAKAAAADHIIYGWLFFSAVILLLVVLGLPFRQDQIRTVPAAPQPPFAGSRTQRDALPPTMLRAGFVALATVIVAALSPTLAAALSSATATPVAGPQAIDVGPGCTVRAIASDAAELPARSQLVLCGGLPMRMTWRMFSPRITAAPLMAERGRLVMRGDTEGHEEHWLATRAASASAWRIITSNDPAFAIAVSVWVNGKPVRPGLAMRIGMAVDSVFGAAFAPIVVTVTPAVDWTALSPGERREAEAGLATFLRSHAALDPTIASLTAR